MPVYNAGNYLDESIPSILNQDYKNIEFIIVDDGSNDNSREIIQKWMNVDSRTRYFFKMNTGISDSLNLGISKAKGKYIARMDADDISLPNRFSTQIKFIKKNNIDVCGSAISEFGSHNKNRYFPKSHHEIVTNLFLFGRTLAHPTVIFRSEIFNKFKYSNKFSRHAQDFLLWMEIFSKSNYKFGNSQIPLLKYRIHGKQIRNRKGVESLFVVKKITSIFLISLNPNITEDDIILNYKFNKLNQISTINDVKLYFEFFNKLKKILTKNKIKKKWIIIKTMVIYYKVINNYFIKLITAKKTDL
ncbi:MAG: glycosyltransferase [Candidatus Marinimicrobia bacterium]|jgi:glycosyltransferase involved in cell wall biosynthesis|nr:glycosyltransferase [Candidatus Neomarinimicrobiota bacterium]